MGRQRHSTDAESRVRLFVARAEVLAQSSVVRERIGASLNISVSTTQPLTMRGTEPNPEQLDSALTRLRPFVHQNDEIFIGRIHSLAFAHLRNAEMRQWLVDSRERWRRAQRHGVFALEVDGAQYSPETVAALWLTWHFHPNGETEAALRKLGIEGGLLTRHVFLDYMYRAIEAVLEAADVIGKALAQDLFDW